MERTHPVPGRPLLVGCAVLVAVLGVRFAHQTTADRLDQAVDTPVVGWLGGHPGLMGWLAFSGSLVPAVALSAAIAGACLLAFGAAGLHLQDHLHLVHVQPRGPTARG
jgi:hypothetical protein